MRQELKKTKNGRTPGIDGIPAELYDADGDVAVKELTRLLNKIWYEEKVPDQCKKGLIVAWHGVAWRDSKVMERVITERIQNGVDHVRRKEQAGFGKDQSRVNQIFLLCNIIKKSMSGWRHCMHTLSTSKKPSTLNTAKDCGES